MTGLQVTSLNGFIEVSLNDISESYSRLARNMNTGMLVIERKDGTGVVTNIMESFESFDVPEIYNYQIVDSINGVEITSNEILFDEIVKIIKPQVNNV